MTCFINYRCGRVEHHGRLAQRSVKRVLRRAGEGAEEKGHLNRTKGCQMQYDYGSFARILFETK